MMKSMSNVIYKTKKAKANRRRLEDVQVGRRNDVAPLDGALVGDVEEEGEVAVEFPGVTTPL